MIELGAAFQELLGLLDRLEIPFLIGGSVASGIHGLPRQTNDIDILADVKSEHVAELCAGLNASFYADAEAVSTAVREGRHFNVIHLRSVFKFDIFPPAMTNSRTPHLLGGTICAQHLDHDYLTHWARELNLQDLLIRAWTESRR